MNGRVWLMACSVALVGCASDDAPADDVSDAGSGGTTTDAGSGSVTASGATSSATSTSSEGSSGAETVEPSTAGPVPDECIDDPSPGDHVYTCDGLTYDVRVPESCADEACGLIFDVHGYTMSGVMEDANTNLRELGSARGYIVVQPNATPAPPAASWEPGIDDDKVFDFMMRSITVFGVDEDRVHFTGFSQGGWMSWRFACAHADVLASVAPGAACGQECDFVTNVPSRPLPILYMHGTLDGLVDYACAEPHRDAVIAAFGLGPEMVVSEGADYRWTRFEGDATFEFLSHDYIAPDNMIIDGHCFPGSDDPGDAPGQLFTFRCDGDNAFHWGEAVMDFFEANPRGT